MKYRCTVEINKPIDEVVEIWNDENNFKHWQDGFDHIELMSGEHNAVGSKSKILIKQGKREIELTETILVSNLPEEKKALYEHIHMTNTQSSQFQDLGEGRTLYISEVEYTKFNGFALNILAKLFPGMFKKQSQKWMNQFKEFAENG